jgi:hypothetical protein
VGKARSRLNSRKHGLTAKTLIIVGENAEDFEELRSALFEQYDPQSTLEFELLERLAGILFRLRRVPFFERAILDAYQSIVSRYHDATPAEDEDEDEADWRASVNFGNALTYGGGTCQDALEKLGRHETTLMNAFTKTLQLLHLLQENCAQSEVEDVVIEVIPPPANAA